MKLSFFKIIFRVGVHNFNYKLREDNEIFEKSNLFLIHIDFVKSAELAVCKGETPLWVISFYL